MTIDCNDICLCRFSTTTSPIASSNSNETDVKFCMEKDVTFSIIRRNLNRNCALPLLFKANAATVGLMDESDEGARIKRYAELLMPLLYETWMEVRPAALNDLHKLNMANDDIHISNEAAFTLKTTLEIIEKLQELMTYWDEEVNNQDLMYWFRMTYNKEFCTQFLLGFPYLQGDGFKGITISPPYI